MRDRRSARELQPFASKVLWIAAAVIVLWMAWRLQGLLLLAFGAILVAVVLASVAEAIRKRVRMPPPASLAVTVFLVALLPAGALWLFGNELAGQTKALSAMMPRAWENLLSRLEPWGLDEPLRRWLSTASSAAGIVSNMRNLAAGVADTVGNLLLVIVGGIYIAAQPALYRSGLLKLFPDSRRALIAEAGDDAVGALRLWLKGRLASMIFVGCATSLGLWLIGVPTALSLGLVSALLEFIPFLGPIIAAVPAVLLAFVQGPETAMWTALLYLLVQQIEGNVLEPLVQQRAVTIPPALLLFGVVAAGLIFGLLGVLLGGPLTVVLYVLVKRLYVRELLQTDTPLPTEEQRDRSSANRTGERT